VFLHSGKRHVVTRGEFAHGRVGAHDPRQDVTPSGIGERPEQLVQSLRRWLSTYNHLVVDNSTVKASKVEQNPTLPFSDDEVERVLIAARALTGFGRYGPKIEPMVLLLRYSGLRMQDAACLERARLVDDKLFLYQQKTGMPVYCPLPPSVVERLKAVQNDNDRFFFYDGTSQPQSMVKSWDRVFQKVFTAAKPAIKGGHLHRFRDTFAVSLLLKGVSIEIVSKLLGHSSIKVTERHYSPWVKARQDQLETEVRRIWTASDAPTV
jgi:integrase/recombinase XerD